MSTIKKLQTEDVASTRTLLHETIPVTGSLSSTLESDIPVDWYIKTTSTGVATNSYIKVGTVTFRRSILRPRLLSN